jgi:hypothetical protein
MKIFLVSMFVAVATMYADTIWPCSGTVSSLAVCDYRSPNMRFDSFTSSFSGFGTQTPSLTYSGGRGGGWIAGLSFAILGLDTATPQNGTLFLGFRTTSPWPLDLPILSFTADQPIGNGGFITIHRIGCSTAFVSNVCTGQSFWDFSVTSTGNRAYGVADHGATPYVVWEQQEITYSNASLSRFNASITVPEPATFSLAAGSIALVLFARKLRSK